MKHDNTFIDSNEDADENTLNRLDDVHNIKQPPVEPETKKKKKNPKEGKTKGKEITEEKNEATSLQFKHVKSALNSLLSKSHANSLSDSDKSKFSSVLELCSPENLSKSKNAYAHDIIDLLIKISHTPCLFFFREAICRFFRRLLLTEYKVEVPLKMRSFNRLVEIEGETEVFKYIIEGYKSIDKRTVSDSADNQPGSGDLSLRNFLLKSLIDTAVSSSNNKALSSIYQVLMENDTPSFIKVLCFSQSSTSLAFLVFSCYQWLESIPFDLNKIKSSKEVEEIAEGFIGSVFDSLHAIYTSNSPVHESALSLFSTDSPRKIWLSVFHRIFMFYLYKNKKRLATVKVINGFDRATQHGIYQKLKTYGSGNSSNIGILVNIFSQINPQYLIVELEKTRDIRVLDGIKRVMGEMREEECKKIYTQHMHILESISTTDSDSLDILTHFIHREHLLFFAAAFVELPEYLKYDISDKMTGIFKRRGDLMTFEHYKDVNVLHMLTYMDNTLQLDTVEISAIILDTPTALFSKSHFFLVKYALVIMIKYMHKINNSLKNRLMPLLKKALSYKEHIKSVGRLYKAWDGEMVSGSSDFSKVVMGATGDRRLLEILKTTEGADVEYGSILYAWYTQSNSSKETQLLTQKFLCILSNNLPSNNSSDVQVALTLECILENLHKKWIIKLCVDNLNVLVDLYFMHSDYISCIFLHLLRHKFTIPQAVIPYILIKYDNQWILRNYYEVAYKSVVMTVEIQHAEITRYISTIQESDATVDRNVLCDFMESVVGNSISNVLRHKHKNKYSMHKVIQSLAQLAETTYEGSKIFVYIMLRSIKGMDKTEREEIIREIEKGLTGEESKEMIEKVKKIYVKGHKGRIEEIIF